MVDLLLSLVVMLTMFQLASAAWQRELLRNEKKASGEALIGEVGVNSKRGC
jgi:hypothetical protein